MKEYLLLTIQKVKRETSSPVKTFGASLALFSFAFLSLLLLPDAARAQNQELRDFHFGNLRKTLTLPAETLTINFDQQKFSYENIAADWWSYRTLTFSSHPVYVFGKQTATLSHIVQQQLGLVNPWHAFKDNHQITGFDLDRKLVSRALRQTIVPALSRRTQNAVLEINNDKIIDFQPDVAGQAVDLPETITKITRALFRRATTTEPAVDSIKPLRTLAEINSLGIKELVAHGESDFSGSSQSRITNIRVGSQRFHGVMLKPGQEFSFNEFLGEVTAETGFLPELVIKSTGTVPELGGGLCQVSTTAFRAALYGGLPITERRNHSYAVKYYAPQGTDATIYPGVVDFKFVNDTAGHLLIATRIEDNKLYFDFYGTKDERKVAIDGPHQYAFGPGGSMKANINRTVIVNGETREDGFFSNYVSQDLFPRVYEYPESPKPELPQELVSPEEPINEETTQPGIDESVEEEESL